MNRRLAIICPMRNESLLIADLIMALEKTIGEINKLDVDVDVIFMDNASTDNTESILKNYSPHTSNRNTYRYIRNRRDIGLQASLMTSMEIATSDALAVLHSDLEDPPELIIEFLNAWLSGAKSVVGVMESRSDPKIYQWTSKIFYRVLRLSSDSHVLTDFTDFFLLDKAIYKDISNRPRTNQYIRGIISSEYGIDERIPYQRRRRAAGTTNFNFAKRYSVALDALFAQGYRIPRYMSIFSVLYLSCGLLSLPITLIRARNLSGENWNLEFIFVSTGFILVVASLSLEILFRIYNFLLNTPKKYEYDEVSLPFQRLPETE